MSLHVRWNGCTAALCFQGVNCGPGCITEDAFRKSGLYDMNLTLKLQQFVLTNSMEQSPSWESKSTLS
jgi:hypothetical protein